MREAVAELDEILLKVKWRIIEWANLDRVKSIMGQNRIAADLGAFNQTIDTYITTFRILPFTELKHQQREMDLCCQQDWQDGKNMFLALARSVKDLEAVVKMRDDIPTLMAIIQEELWGQQPETEEHETLRECLDILHVETGILPPLTDLTGQILKFRGYSISGGDTKDIYEGRWVGVENVMLKAIQGVEKEPTIKRLHREVADWRRLHHPNVLEFYGICRESSRIFTVTPWESNGDLLMYLQRHPECDRMKLLSEVALALNYIHRFKPVIIHGDLRAANVLVSGSGEALLAGFGQNQIIVKEAGAEVVSTYLRKSGSLRWMAPELFDRGTGPSPVSTSSDVWSFGMLCLELFTGHPPYSGCTDEQVVIKLMRSGLPDRPVCLCEDMDSMWALMQRCWVWCPELRPRMPLLAEDMLKLREESRQHWYYGFDDFRTITIPKSSSRAGPLENSLDSGCMPESMSLRMTSLSTHSAPWRSSLPHGTSK
ncbi:hypothetical protein FRC08_016200 [Ceratobasidium sp. 394]|nr:hypothetical protein FRC08_016200 [Ceratobasidium sp. 394]